MLARLKYKQEQRGSEHLILPWKIRCTKFSEVRFMTAKLFWHFLRNPEHKGLLQWMKGEIQLWPVIMHCLIVLNLVSHLFPTQYSISLYSFNKHFNMSKLFLGVGKQWIRSSSKVQNWAEIKMKKASQAMIHSVWEKPVEQGQKGAYNVLRDYMEVRWCWATGRGTAWIREQEWKVMC